MNVLFVGVINNLNTLKKSIIIFSIILVGGIMTGIFVIPLFE